MHSFYLDICIALSYGVILFYEILFDIGSPTIITCVEVHDVVL